MCAADDSPDGFVYDALDQLRHDLKTPLTTIYAHAYLLARRVRRSSSLSDGERGTMLEGVATIEEAVRAMVITIDGMAGRGGGAPR
jgi:signal transduction histidine kinase